MSHSGSLSSHCIMRINDIHSRRFGYCKIGNPYTSLLVSDERNTSGKSNLSFTVYRIAHNRGSFFFEGSAGEKFKSW